MTYTTEIDDKVGKFLVTELGILQLWFPPAKIRKRFFDLYVEHQDRSEQEISQRLWLFLKEYFPNLIGYESQVIKIAKRFKEVIGL